MMTRAEQNRQAAIEQAIEPLVGTTTVAAPGMSDMPQSLNGLRAALFALLTRQAMLEQFVTAKFADMAPRLALAEQTVASTQAQGTATAALAAFLDAKDALQDAAIQANALDTLALQKRAAAEELALATLQARATADEALITATKDKADAAQFEATMAKGAAAAAQQKAEAAAAATTTAKAAADAAQATASTAQAGLATLTGRFRTKRLSTPAVAIGGTMKIDVTWDVPFPDDKYNAVAEFEGLGLLGLTAVVTNRTATGCTVVSKNVLGLQLLAGAGMVTVTAIHDQV
jgi:hypothetical protein